MAPPCCFRPTPWGSGCLVLGLGASAHPWLGVWPPGTPERAVLWSSLTLTLTPRLRLSILLFVLTHEPPHGHLPCLCPSCHALSPGAESAGGGTLSGPPGSAVLEAGDSSSSVFLSLPLWFFQMWRPRPIATACTPKPPLAVTRPLPPLSSPLPPPRPLWLAGPGLAPRGQGTAPSCPGSSPSAQRTRAVPSSGRPGARARPWSHQRPRAPREAPSEVRQSPSQRSEPPCLGQRTYSAPC